MAVVDAKEHAAAVRKRGAGAQLRLGEGFTKIFTDAHHFTGRSHLRTEGRVDAGEFVEREHGRLHEALRHGQDSGYQASGEMCEIAQLFAGHQSDSDLGERHSGSLGDERYGARGARVDFEHVDRRVLDRVLHVHQADNIQRFREAHSVVFDGGEILAAERMRGQHA